MRINLAALYRSRISVSLVLLFVRFFFQDMLFPSLKKGFHSDQFQLHTLSLHYEPLGQTNLVVTNNSCRVDQPFSDQRINNNHGQPIESEGEPLFGII